MGCAPSAELLHDAPFRPPQGGVRQVALIPIVAQYFPTPDCPLFRQLYEAYTDPSVRYYVRSNFDGANGDLSRIPEVANSREELHHLLLQLTSSGMFATNAEVRAAYATGEFYRIRPTLCAVVFLYEGANYVPEGSVQLPTRGRGPSVFVKVIGVVGDTTTMLRKASDPVISFTSRDTLKMQTLITKSAGDHNMSRVVLLASYIYYHQCCEVIGLPKVPSMAASFTCFKTNIPFLCFLREMRERTASVLEGPKDSKFYIDEFCLHGSVTAEYVDLMMPAFAYYFVSFLNAKSEQRLVKQLAHQQRLGLLHRDGEQGGNSALPPPSFGSGGGAPSTGGDSTENALSGAEHDDGEERRLSQAMVSIAKTDAAANPNVPAPKVTYIVKGYITRPAVSLSAWSCAPNEVYVTCMDSVVTVVDRKSVDAPAGPTHTPKLNQPDGVAELAEERDAPASSWPVVESFTVRRGDILSFYTPNATEAAEKASHVSAAAAAEEGDAKTKEQDTVRCYREEGDSESLSSSQADCLRLSTDNEGEGDDVGRDSSNGHRDHHHHHDSPDTAKVAAAAEPSGSEDAAAACTPRKGSWRVDESIFIESVLLSLVRDECKLAREADVDDPRWVHDDARNCPVHDGSFYVWHFRRGQENFFYGTVPKFANTNRIQPGGAGARGQRSNRVRVMKNGVVMTEAYAGGVVRMESAATNQSGGSNSTSGSQPLAAPGSGRLSLPSSLFGPLPTALAAGGQQQQQQQQEKQPPPPSYLASHAAAAAAATVPASAGAQPGSGPVFLFAQPPASSAPGPFVYSVPYLFSGQPAPMALQPSLLAQGTHINAFAAPQQQQQQQSSYSVGADGGIWGGMNSAAAGTAVNLPGQGMGGEAIGTPTHSALTNTSSAINTPASLPYMINAQGQLVPMLVPTASRVQPEGMHNTAAMTASPPPTQQPQQPQQIPSYVVVNGQLCTLQPAPTGAAAPATLAPYPQQQKQSVQYHQQLPPNPYGAQIYYVPQ